ncbi:MAG: hypothetical protein EP326_12205 [Deltaproteobacteria bacterium]|nr:MAG: hypothetical protein EP326_12205 [Deltaproteobacteria bacterium]TNF26134.1 MAG: hypothetical protein EP319_14625 [Deltaproteobacteria bacterium]
MKKLLLMLIVLSGVVKANDQIYIGSSSISFEKKDWFHFKTKSLGMHMPHVFEKERDSSVKVYVEASSWFQKGNLQKVQKSFCKSGKQFNRSMIEIAKRSLCFEQNDDGIVVYEIGKSNTGPMNTVVSYFVPAKTTIERSRAIASVEEFLAATRRSIK